MTISPPADVSPSQWPAGCCPHGAIRQMLASHLEVEAAILYGSRALGCHRPASDIDLTLIGSTISAAALARIDADLDDLSMICCCPG